MLNRKLNAFSLTPFLAVSVLGAWISSFAPTQAKASGPILLSYNEFKRLPAQKQDQVMQAYVDFLIRYEKSHPHSFSQISSSTLLFEKFVSLWISDAVAGPKGGGTQVLGTWDMTRSGNGVLPPEAAPFKKDCPGRNEAPCNPGLVGAQEGGKAFCFNKSSQDWTAQCAENSRAYQNDPTQADKFIKPTAPQYAQLNDSIISSIQQVPQLRSDPSLKAALNGLVHEGNLMSRASTPPVAQKSQAAATPAAPSAAAPVAQAPGEAPTQPAAQPPQPDRALTDQGDRLANHGTDLEKFNAKKFYHEDQSPKGVQAVARAKDDPCAVSNALGAAYGCKDTYDTLKKMEVTAGVALAAGEIMTQVKGAQANNEAAKSGTQGGALAAAAGAQKSAAETQIALGLGGMAAAAVQYNLATKHEENKGLFKDTLANRKNLEENLQADGWGSLAEAKKAKYEEKGGQVGRDLGTAKGQHGYIEVRKDAVVPEIAARNNALLEKVMTDEANFGDMNGGKIYDASAEQKALDAAKKQAAQICASGAGNQNCVQAQANQGQAEANYRVAMQKRNQGFKIKATDVTNSVEAVGNEAVSEQDAVASAAKKAAYASGLVGLVKTLQGYSNAKVAEQLQNAANSANQAANAGVGFSSSAAMAGQDATAARTAVSIGGNGLGGAPSSSAATDGSGTAGGPSLGTPVALTPAPQGLNGPAPSAANFKNEALAAGKSGGSGAGGGSTSAATAGSTEDSPKLADGRGGVAYEGGGGAGAGGYRGGGSGSGGDKGPDLSGMLAQFLPKKDDEAGAQKNGILDFGGRAPANDDGISLLDRKTNIFDRVSQTYKDKSRKLGL